MRWVHPVFPRDVSGKVPVRVLYQRWHKPVGFAIGPLSAPRESNYQATCKALSGKHPSVANFRTQNFQDLIRMDPDYRPGH